VVIRGDYHLKDQFEGRVLIDYYFLYVCVSVFVFLADRTNGHAYRTMLCLSVCLSSSCLSVCNVCIVAKRSALSKNCLKKQIWLPDRYSVKKSEKL